jgi:uncharacterized protein (TIGR02453 family)
MTSSFNGISRSATRLIVELAHRQDREWYSAHKPQIDAQIYAPLRALLADASAALRRTYGGHELTAKVFRIHRDVRFSKDKSPFKDHASGVLMVGANRDPGTAIGALYLQVGPDQGAAAGHWMMAPDALARYRKAVLDPERGARLQKLLAPLLERGYQLVSAQQLSRAPRGVDPSHPRASLLRHKGLALDFPPIPPRVRYTSALASWCIERAKEVAPVVRWLLQHSVP